MCDRHERGGSGLSAGTGHGARPARREARRTATLPDADTADRCGCADLRSRQGDAPQVVQCILTRPTRRAGCRAACFRAAHKRRANEQASICTAVCWHGTLAGCAPQHAVRGPGKGRALSPLPKYSSLPARQGDGASTAGKRRGGAAGGEGRTRGFGITGVRRLVGLALFGLSWRNPSVSSPP